MDQIKTVRELKEEALLLGADQKSLDTLQSKAAVEFVIKLLEQNKSLSEKKEQVQQVVPESAGVPAQEKVKTIDEVPNPKEDKEVNARWLSKAKIMMDLWMKEPKTQILYPSEPGRKAGVVEWTKDKLGNDIQVAKTPPDTIEEIQVNGAKWLIPKGVLVEVPVRVAKLVAERLQLASTAGSNISLERIDPLTGKSVGESF